MPDTLEPVWYACQRCGACCQWPGDVIVTGNDVARLAVYLDLDETSFIAKHTRLSANRRHLSLLEKDDGSCEFYRDRSCLVQEAKPEQCAGFPNQWNFPGWRDVCEAVPVKSPPASQPPPAAPTRSARRE